MVWGKYVLLSGGKKLPRHTSVIPAVICKGDERPTCIVAESLPLLSSPVQPDAETHEDDPAGPSNTRDESRLLNHICDLLCDTVVPVPVYNHIPKLFT